MLKSASTQDRRNDLSRAMRTFAMALVAACTMTTLTVAADAASKPAPAPTAAPAASESTPVATAPVPATTLERIRSSGRLVLGYRADAAPMSYRDAAGKPAGYSILLCTKVADALRSQLSLPSLEVHWVSAGYVDLQQHAVDLICADDEITQAHRAVASFSIPVFPGGISALLRTDALDQLQRVLEERPAPYQPLWRGTPPPTLSHRTYSAIGGSEALATLKQRIAEMHLTASVAPVDSYDAGVAAILQRRSDVLFGDRAQLLQAVQRSPDGKHLRVLSQRYVFAATAFAMARNDDDFRLAVDQALTAIIADPQFGALYAASFGTPDADTVAFFRAVGFRSKARGPPPPEQLVDGRMMSVRRICRRASALLAPAVLFWADGAHASFLSGEALDSFADGLAWFILIVMPPAAIGLFWMVHVLPQKAAEKRHHPQKEAIHVLCLLSLFFGGLLWPFAWLWAYTRPSIVAMSTGTEKHEDYFVEHADQAEAGALPLERVSAVRQELDGLEVRGLLTPPLRAVRDRLKRAEESRTDTSADGTV